MEFPGEGEYLSADRPALDLLGPPGPSVPPWPPLFVIIPCHRAIRSDGTLGEFQGGVEMKRVLLKMEGVLSDASYRVVEGQLFY